MSTIPQRPGGSARAVPMTCSSDGRRHDVVDEEFARGAAVGRYEAACGALVLAASLSEPPGPRCPRCAAVSVVAPAPLQPASSRTVRRAVAMWLRSCRCAAVGADLTVVTSR